MRVGFVGTGTMGTPIAGCLIRAGHALTVFDRRADATAELRAQGATFANSAFAVARDTEVVFTSLPGPAEFEPFRHRGHGQPVHPRGFGHPRHRHRPVAIAIGFDTDEQFPGRSDRPADSQQVGPDVIQMDDEMGLVEHGMNHTLHQARLRICLEAGTHQTSGGSTTMLAGAG